MIETSRSQGENQKHVSMLDIKKLNVLSLNFKADLD